MLHRSLMNRAIMSETPAPTGDLEARISKLESRVEKLESALADPARKAQSRSTQPAVKPALTTAQKAADAAMIAEAARRAANIRAAQQKIMNQVSGRAA